MTTQRRNGKKLETVCKRVCRVAEVCRVGNLYFGCYRDAVAAANGAEVFGVWVERDPKTRKITVVSERKI